MAQCSTCGSNVPDNAVVCPDCGMELKPSIPPEMAGSTPSSAPASGQAPPSAPQAPTFTPSPIPGQSKAASAGARLTLRRGGALTQEVFPLGTGPTVIGRFDPETGPVDIDIGPLPEAVYVSRHHAEVWCNASGQWFVKDLGSGNGTFVCAVGQRQFQKATGDHPLKHGDEIALGNARFEFCVG
jgi:pSer/pThr/pTyr-binding forkhead associated (FHA) protein